MTAEEKKDKTVRVLSTYRFALSYKFCDIPISKSEYFFFCKMRLNIYV